MKEGIDALIEMLWIIVPSIIATWMFAIIWFLNATGLEDLLALFIYFGMVMLLLLRILPRVFPQER